MTFTSLTNPFRLIGFLFVSALLSGTALPNQSIQTTIRSGGSNAQVGNLQLSSQQEDDLVNFLKILNDGYTKPNPVSP